MEHTFEAEEKIKQDNYKVFALLSNYLNNAPDFISKEAMDEIAGARVSTEYAFSVLLAAAFGLDIVDKPEDKALFHNYFTKMFHKLETSEFADNLYYRNIKIPRITIGNSELKYGKYQPFEGFVCNDIIQTEEGRQIPQVGFFESEFAFPAVLENGRIWMTITPNEIETMKEPVAQAFGKVLTFGLGLGYYAYMVSEKDNVDSVTIVESNENVIRLFKRHILPQFKHAHKIEIIKADAFDFARTRMAEGQFDFAFMDLWHDVSDGLDMYLKLKEYEKSSPKTVFSYWIEKSILCYL